MTGDVMFEQVNIANNDDYLLLVLVNTRQPHYFHITSSMLRKINLIYKFIEL